MDVVLSLNQSRTYSIRGVSDSDLGSGKGGSNFVTVSTPFCAACTDADGDGFASAEGGCGAWDCNDAAPPDQPHGRRDRQQRRRRELQRLRPDDRRHEGLLLQRKENPDDRG